MPTALTFVGLGNMGGVLAGLLVEAGSTTTVWNRTAAKAAPLERIGAASAADVATAIEQSPVTIACLAHYEQVYAVLEQAEAAGTLRGRTIVNLTWGGAEEARAMDAWVRERGAAYLDGAILGYPSEMGTPSSSILYAGERQVYEELEPLLRPMARPSYRGEDAAASNVLGAASGLIFYHAALVAFLEAIAYTSHYGIAPSSVFDLMDDMLELLRKSFRSTAGHIESGDYETDQASNQIHFDAARITQANMLEIGQSATLTGAVGDMIEPLITAGEGERSIALLHDLLLRSRADAQAGN